MSGICIYRSVDVLMFWYCLCSENRICENDNFLISRLFKSWYMWNQWFPYFEIYQKCMLIKRWILCFCDFAEIGTYGNGDSLILCVFRKLYVWTCWFSDFWTFPKLIIVEILIFHSRICQNVCLSRSAFSEFVTLHRSVFMEISIFWFCTFQKTVFMSMLVF